MLSNFRSRIENLFPGFGHAGHRRQHLLRRPVCRRTQYHGLVLRPIDRRGNQIN
jgi:hypothetical protein